VHTWHPHLMYASSSIEERPYCQHWNLLWSWLGRGWATINILYLSHCIELQHKIQKFRAQETTYKHMNVYSKICTFYIYCLIYMIFVICFMNVYHVICNVSWIPLSHCVDRQISLEKWTRTLYARRRKKHVATNLAECMTSILKGARSLTIWALVKTTFERTNAWFVERGMNASVMLWAGH